MEDSLQETILTSEPLYDMDDFQTNYYKLESEYRILIKKVEELESDKVLLVEDLNESEAYIGWQEEEIKKLKTQLENLSTTPNRSERSEFIEEKSPSIQAAIIEYESKIAAKTKENEDLLKSNKRMKEAVRQIAKNFIDSIQKIPRKESHQFSDLEKILQQKDGIIKTLEEENEIMVEEMKNYEEYITDHIAQMKKLAFYIDRLTSESQQTQDCKSINYLNTKINAHKIKLKKEIQNNKILTQQIKKLKKSKEETEKALAKTVKIYKNLLKENQDLKQKSSVLKIQNIELDTLRMKAYKLEDLEQQNKCMVEELKCCKCRENELLQQQMDLVIQIDDLSKEICDYKSAIFLKDQNNNILLNTLDYEKSEVTNLKSLLKNHTRSENELKEMLAQARSTIKEITQKLEENDIERLELEDRSQNISEKYNTLKRVLYEKDKSFDELRNQLVTLKNLLDREQQVREDNANLAAAGDSEIAQQVKSLNDEISRLKKELESLMVMSPMGRLRSKIKKLENENFDLNLEVKKFVIYLKRIVPGYINPEELKRLREQLSNLTKEVNQQKNEVENQKKMRAEIVEELKQKIDEHEEHCNQIKKLIKENAELKSKLDGNEKQDVIPEKIIYLEKSTPNSLNQPKTQIFEETKKPKYNQKKEIDQKKLEALAIRTQEVAMICDKFQEAKANFPKFDSNKKRIDQNFDTIVKLEKKAFYPQEDVKRLKDELKLPHDDTEIKFLQEKLSSANQEIIQLKKQIQNSPQEELSEKIQELTSANDILRNQLKKANQQHNSNQETEKIIQELQDKLNLANNEIQELTQQLDNIKVDGNATDNLRNELEKAKLEMNDLRNKLDEANEQNVNLQEKITTKNIQPLSAAFTQQTDQSNELKDCEEFKRKIQNLEEQNRKLLTENLDLKEKCKYSTTSELYHSQMKEIKDNMLSWQQQMQNNLEKMTAKIKHIEEFDLDKPHPSSTQDLLDQLDNFKSELEVSAGKKRVTIMQDTQEKHIAELDRQLQASRDENRKLKEKLSNVAHSSSNSSDNYCKEIEQKLKNCKIQKENLQAEVDKLRFQRMSFMSVVEDTDEKEMQLPKPIAGINTDDERVKELEKRLIEWQKNYYRDIAKLQSEMRGITFTPQGADTPQDTIIKSLEANLQESQYKIDNLLKTNMQLEADNEQLTAAMKFETEDKTFDNENNNKMHSLVEHLRTVERKNQTLKTRVVQLEVDNARLRNDLESVLGRDPKSFEEEMKRLRNLERSATKCQEKYQAVRKRLTKVEIENKNLQKEYINILIEREKLVLQAHENTSRFRETGRLLKKAQDKQQSLTDRVIKMQNENEKLRRHLETFITSPDGQEGEDKDRSNINTLTAKNTVLEEENVKLRDLLKWLTENDNADNAVPKELIDFLALPQDEDLRFKTILLKLENETLVKEIDNIKNRDIVSLAGDLAEQKIAEHFGDLQQIDQNQKADMKAMELQIENDYLRKEISLREKMGGTYAEKKLNELEDENHKLSENIENLKKSIVDLELENEYLKNEMDKMGKFLDVPQTDVVTLEKQNHTFRIKIEQMEKEIERLNQHIECMGKAEMDVQIHYQKKLIHDIEQILDMKNNLKKTPSMEKKDVEDLDTLLELWKNKYEPQLEEMKKNVHRLIGKETLISKLENQIEDYKELVNKLEDENQNMKTALDILLQEKGVITNTKLVERIEEQLKKYNNEPKQMSAADQRRMKQLEKEVDDIQEINKFLRKEKLLLKEHMREIKIQDLEMQVAQLQALTKVNRGEIPKQLNIQETNNLKQLNELLKLKESLQKQIDNLNSDRTLMQNELKSLQTENEDLKKEIGTYEKISEQQQKIKADLEKQLEEIKISSPSTRKVGFEHEEYEILKIDFRALHEKYEEKNKRLGELEKRHAKCKEANSELKQKVAVLHTNFETLQKNYEDNDREELEEKEKRILELEEQLRKCRETNKDLKNRISTMEKNFQFKENEESNPNTEENNDEDNQKINKSASYSNDVDGKQHKQQLKMYTVQKENNILKGKIEQLQNSLEQKLNKLKVIQAENDSLRDEYRKLQNQTKKVRVLDQRFKEINLKYNKVKSDLDRLQKAKVSGTNKRSDNKIIELEKQLAEKQNENEVFKESLEYLRKELLTKDSLEEENKNLKDQINLLTKKINIIEEDNIELKNELNELSQIKDNLLKINNELEDRLKLLGCGEYEIINRKLEDNTQENYQLKQIISDLQDEIEIKKQELEESNEEIKKLKLSLLEAGGDSKNIEDLIKEIRYYFEQEKLLINNENYIKLEEILKTKLQISQQPDFPNKRLLSLEKQIGCCKEENEKLKKSTLRLEEEIINLRKSLPDDHDNILVCNEQQRIETLEHELIEQKKKWKTVLSRLKNEQYNESIVARNNPWVPNTYSMPVLWQPIITYPQVFENKLVANENFEQLSDIIQKIEETLIKSRQVLGNEIQKSSKQIPEDLSDDKDEVVCDFYNLNVSNFSNDFYKQEQSKRKANDLQENIRVMPEKSKRRNDVEESSEKCSYKCLKRDNDRFPSIFPHYRIVREEEDDNLEKNLGPGE